jgi:hypothetical protein
MMKYKVYKLFINFEKEEKWLNDMSAKGLHLIDYSFPGRYLFEEGTPGEFVYRIELLENMPSNIESKAYIQFMENNGVEFVASHFRWVFFRKKATDGPFDLYSDYESRIKHYKKVLMLVGIVVGINFFAAAFNSFIGIFNLLNGNSAINLYFSIVNWILVFTIFPLILSYNKKVKQLKKDRLLFD